MAQVPEPYRSILLKLVEVLERRFGDDLVSVVLFGSVARGEARPDSDVDLIIVVRNLPRGRFRRQDLFMEVEKELEPLLEELERRGYYIEFSPILKTPEEASRVVPLYLDLVEDAVLLYDRDDFFRNILENLRRRLEELGAERVRFGKLWYWRLKRDYRFGEVIEI
ncbi:MAG: nucleotidyltransferase domain-containing protein [Thermoprotei archaeon]|nr:MAG: nucleotidyltransferase domain-containing protein [Thermoprotei archaeon]RLE56767.1 MAG: nucleotidyltransferase domain-containing protein [Thermoprotei archaeon]